METTNFTKEQLEAIEKYETERDSKKEIWRYIYIDGKKTHYRISTYGRIHNRIINKIYNFKPDSNRYVRISIRHEANEYKYYLHRLVAEVFCKIPRRHREKGLLFKDLYVNHKNGIKFCNASFNLEWITHKENCSHAWDNGLCDNIRGENTHLSKITETTAIQICGLIMEKKTDKEIVKLLKKYGVTKKVVQHIRSGESWKHISCKYDFPKLGNSKPNTFTEETIHEICKLLEQKKFTDKYIGDLFGVSRKMVNDIRLKKRRTKISSQYNF